MDGKSKTAHQNIKRKPIRWHLLILLAILLVFMAISYGVRTSTYLQLRLNPKLSDLGEFLGGSFEYTNIHAMGMTGIILSHVKFRPAFDGAHAIDLGTVTIYPALWGMVYGDLNASAVELNNVKVDWEFSHQNSGDAEWIKYLLQRLNEQDLVSEVSVVSYEEESALPKLICRSCHLNAVLPGDYQIEVSVPEQTLDVYSVHDKEIQFSGSSFKTCLLDIKDKTSDCMEMSLEAIRFDEPVHAVNLSIRDLHSHGIRIDQMKLDSVSFSHNHERTHLYIDSGSIHCQLLEDSIFTKIAGTYELDFDQLELVHEIEAQRIGIGGSFIEQEQSLATIYGGYHLKDQKLALTLEAQQFDLAHYLKNTELSDKLVLNSFPVTGTIRFVWEPQHDLIWTDLDIGIADAVLSSPMIAKDEISGLYANLMMQLWINPGEKTIVTNPSHVFIGDIPLDFTFQRQRLDQDDYQVDLIVQSIGESDGFLRSLPKGFAPALEGYELTGPYRFQIALSYKDSNLDALRLAADFELDQVQTVKYDPRSDFERLKGDAFMIRINTASIPLTIGPRDPNWVKFYDLPRETAYAFVASEDTRFFSHQGFDLRAIRASLIADLKADKVVRGGSTISQQVVKNLFLNQDKTISRKFQEAFLTWQMEQKLPKIRIFEFYLNLAQWAKDTYGIKAAAQFYFNKNVNQLTLRESLFLVAILPNPIIFGKQYADNNLSSSRINKMLMVGTFLRDAKRISSDTWEEAIPLIREGKISDRPRPVIE